MAIKNRTYSNIEMETRKEVYIRDGFRCALCDSTDGLQIHHYIKRGLGGHSHPHNLITLCWRCHGAAHGYQTFDGQPDVDEMEVAIVEYLSDYYVEHGEIWDPHLKAGEKAETWEAQGEKYMAKLREDWNKFLKGGG